MPTELPSASTGARVSAEAALALLVEERSLLLPAYFDRAMLGELLLPSDFDRAMLGERVSRSSGSGAAVSTRGVTVSEPAAPVGATVGTRVGG